MSSFFISHSSEDSGEAARLCARLELAGYSRPFVSSEPDHTIAAGRRWESELYRQLQARDAVIFLGTPASTASRWCFAELALARALGKPVYAVWTGDAGAHPLIADTQGVRLSPDRDAAYGRLLRDLEQAGLKPGEGFTWDGSGNPYPGLRSYGIDDAAVFFGRADEAKDLVNRLRAKPFTPARAALVVVGPSGCGKSSLVRAGLLPRLRRAATEWLVVDPIVPGSRPLGALARALAVTARRAGLAWNWREVEEELRRPNARLADRLWDVMLASALPEGQAKVVLVVDQLEELLRTAIGEREAFAALLSRALADDDLPVRVVATLRSGSVGPAMDEPALLPLLQNQVVIGRLGRAQMREVIEGPARVAVIALTPGLTDKILDEAVGADALPLLAFTLARLVDGAAEPGTVTLDDYERTGGVVRALESTGDDILASAEQQFGRDTVAAALMTLVTLDAAGLPMRSRVARSSLTGETAAVLERFEDARLLTSSEAEGEMMIEVAHEALFRVWKPLRLLIEARGDELKTRAELTRAAEDWERGERRPSYVLRGDRLAAAAQRWLERHNAPVALRAFIDASLREDAGTREREADQLANRVLRDHADDPERGVLLALAAIDTYARTPRTLLALSTALAGWRVERILSCDDWVHVAVFSPDASRVAALTSTRILLYDAATGERCGTLELPAAGSVMASNQALVWSRDGRRLFAGQYGSVTIWDAKEQRLERQIEVGATQCVALAVSPARDLLALAIDDGTVCLLRLDEPDAQPERFTAHKWGAQAVGFTPDGRGLVTGGRDRQATLWQLDPPTAVVSWPHEDSVWAVDCSPVRPLIATVAPEDGRIRLWDTEQQAAHSELRTGAWGYGVRFGRDGQLASTSGRELLLWDDPTTDTAPRRLKGRRVGRQPRFSADGQRLVLDHERDGIWIWDVRPPGPALSLAADVDAACFAGPYVVTRQRDALKVCRPEDGREVASWTAPQEFLPRLDASADGRFLATDHPDGLRVWSVPDGRLVHHAAGFDAWPRFATDGRLLLFTREGQCEVWSVDPLERLHACRVTDTSLWTADLVPGGDLVVTCGERVSVWGVGSGALVRHLDASMKGDPHVAIAPNGKRVALSSSQGEADAGLWDLESGQLVQPLAWGKFNPSSAYAPVATSIAFAPDGERLATTCADGTAQIWDAARGELVQLFVIATDGTRSACFSPDGQWIVTTEREGPAKVWSAPSADVLIERARARAFRVLSDEERQEYGLVH